MELDLREETAKSLFSIRRYDPDGPPWERLNEIVKDDYRARADQWLRDHDPSFP